MKREFELTHIELEEEAELEHLMLKTKLEHEVKKIEKKVPRRQLSQITIDIA